MLIKLPEFSESKDVEVKERPLDEDPAPRGITIGKKYLITREYTPSCPGCYTAKHNLKVAYEAKVSKISKDGDFRIETENGNVYTCEKLIMATGVNKPFIPKIKGIENCKTYLDVSVNPEDFINKSVLIIGKGNSGFETADNLVSTASKIHVCSPTPLKLAWKTHFVGHLRAVNNNFLDTYQLKSQKINNDRKRNNENIRRYIKINKNV